MKAGDKIITADGKRGVVVKIQGRDAVGDWVYRVKSPLGGEFYTTDFLCRKANTERKTKMKKPKYLGKYHPRCLVKLYCHDTGRWSILPTFGVTLRDKYTEITYYTQHGGEECEEIPFDADIREWLDNAYRDYDPSYEASLWCELGHGINGAPYDFRDILADKEEWESKLNELSISAAKYAA